MSKDEPLLVKGEFQVEAFGNGDGKIGMTIGSISQAIPRSIVEPLLNDMIENLGEQQDMHRGELDDDLENKLDAFLSLMATSLEQIRADVKIGQIVTGGIMTITYLMQMMAVISGNKQRDEQFKKYLLQQIDTYWENAPEFPFEIDKQEVEIVPTGEPASVSEKDRAQAIYSPLPKNKMS